MALSEQEPVGVDDRTCGCGRLACSVLFEDNMLSFYRHLKGVTELTQGELLSVPLREGWCARGIYELL